MTIPRPRNSNVARRWLLLTTLAGSFCASGCQSLPRPFAKRGGADDPNLSIADVQGPTERKLRAANWERQRQEMAADPSSNISIAYEQLEAAQKLFDEGRHREAEKAFAGLAKERRATYESFRARWERWWGLKDRRDYDPYENFGDPVEEDALFMTGECQFAQAKFAAAQDSYDDVLNRYPNSRHLDHISRQLFRIARHWLEFPDDIGANGDAEVQVASARDDGFKLRSVAVIPNLTDRSRPVFDTYGRGLQALSSVWLKDATGPLADDALMLAANHYVRRENFVEAARHFSLLREQYPDSPHFQNAFVIGSYVALASYEGPAYDATGLKEARDLKETTLQLFPDLPEEKRRKLQEEVQLIADAEIARYWEKVEFYEAKSLPESMALHCYYILNVYPDSKYADMARLKLQEIEPQLRGQNGGQGFWRWRPKADEAVQPLEELPETRSEVTLPATPSAPEPATTGEPEKKKRNFFGFLRRAETPPQLEPVPSPDSEDASGRTGL